MLRKTRCRWFCGNTAGGVKKVVASKIDYNNWALAEGSRSLLASVHHPLVVEYFVRLDEKRRVIEKWLEEIDPAKKTPLVNKIDGSAFDQIAWNTAYRDELDVAERAAQYFRELNDNVALKDQLVGKKEQSPADAEMLEMVEEDIASLIDKIKEMDGDVTAIMERRLGSEDIVGSSSRTWNVTVSGRAGGEEAGLFAAELTEMFKAYAKESRGWRVGTSGKDSGGDGNEGGVCSDNEFQLIGENVYRNMHHEIGVHKVQRVPVTDAAGKMQTSTAVVTIMPELDPVSVNVQESDCNIDFVRGSGPGGQGMQSSSNCVVLTHRPSGISVKCHQSRSALGNKELALQMVAQQILSQRVKDQNNSLHEAWNNQWSSGERSDKMRTYNFPQNRVTDHRVGKDYPLVTFMEQGKGLIGLHDELNALSDQGQLNNVLLKHINGEFGSVV